MKTIFQPNVTGRLFRCLLVALALFTIGAADAHAQLKLSKGDHISFIGNNLADRMQHDGWLETLIQSRYPDYQLVFRNLGFPGDEINKRPRSANFGTPEQWLTKTKTDVVFAFFGHNESFAGSDGLASFRKNLESFIDQTRQQNFSGTGPARLVLFSPIAHENLGNRLLPDGSENNGRLVLYASAMKDVAAQKGVPFVDLFSTTRKLYDAIDKPLTMNGIHLNTLGNRTVAEFIDRSLFGPPAARNNIALEKIRQEIGRASCRERV